jgi:hypothetical protein
MFFAKICKHTKYAENSVITTRYGILLYPNTPKTGAGLGIVPGKYK